MEKRSTTHKWREGTQHGEGGLRSTFLSPCLYWWFCLPHASLQCVVLLSLRPALGWFFFGVLLSLLGWCYRSTLPLEWFRFHLLFHTGRCYFSSVLLWVVPVCPSLLLGGAGFSSLLLWSGAWLPSPFLVRVYPPASLVYVMPRIYADTQADANRSVTIA